MTDNEGYPLGGGCTCGAVRYRITTPPIYVHCCHCRWCQRETGAAFALNAMIEADRVELPEGALSFLEYYDRKARWPAESLARSEAALAKAAN